MREVNSDKQNHLQRKGIKSFGKKTRCKDRAILSKAFT